MLHWVRFLSPAQGPSPCFLWYHDFTGDAPPRPAHPTIRSYGVNRAIPSSSVMLGITQDQCPSARLTGPRHTELMWLNFGILIGKESHFPVWFLREKDACPWVDGPLPTERKAAWEWSWHRRKQLRDGREKTLRLLRRGLRPAWDQLWPRPLTMEACWRGSSRGCERQGGGRPLTLCVLAAQGLFAVPSVVVALRQCWDGKVLRPPGL